MAVTLKDIAKQVGKSVTTVSRALNGFDDVSPETKALVKQAAAKFGYTANTHAQRLQKRRTDTLGLIIPTSGKRFADPFFSELLAGIGNKATELGYDLLVSTQPEGENEIQAYHTLVEGRRVDGFIVARTYRQDERIDYLSIWEIPFVAFGRIDGHIHFPFVDVDSDYGMRKVVGHLVEVGHCRIAYIASNPEFYFTSCRVNGIHEGLSNHGIHVKDEYGAVGDLSQRSGYIYAGKFLDLPIPPTAIVACNDLMAFGAIRAAQERGLVVGRDIAITGFDDIPMAEDTNPPLTTVHQPTYQIGTMVCQMLVKLINGEVIEEKQVIVKPGLIIRQSTSPKRR